MSPASAPAATVEGPAPVFAALGDPTRLALVARLGTAGPLSIAQLTSGAPLTRQAITKHLKVLSGAGLVSDRREGREHVWQLDIRPVEAARGYLEQISLRWDEALGRLKRLLEDPAGEQ